MIAFADRVKERATVSGADPYVLTGAVVGHRSFAQGFASDTKCHYCAEFGITWEVGIGQLETGTGQIVRKKVLSTSDNSASITWPNGSNVQVSCVAASSAIQAGFMQGVKVAMPGNLKVMEGTAKWYAPQTTVLTTLDAWVGIQPTGSDVKFDLIKNGVQVGTTITIPSSSSIQQVACALAYDTFVNILADMNGDNMFDGVLITVGMRVLLIDHTGVNFASDAYVVGGVPGNWNVTRATPNAVLGDKLFSTGGETYPNKYWLYDGTTWAQTVVTGNSPRTVVQFNPVLVLNPGDWLSMNVTQIGSTTPGSDLNVRLT